jgi:hypothetical protein
MLNPLAAPLTQTRCEYLNAREEDQLADSKFEPKLGDEVLAIGQSGVYLVIEVNHDLHTVALKNKATADMLTWVPWNVLKYAKVKLV